MTDLPPALAASVDRARADSTKRWEAWRADVTEAMLQLVPTRDVDRFAKAVADAAGIHLRRIVDVEAFADDIRHDVEEWLDVSGYSTTTDDYESLGRTIEAEIRDHLRRLDQEG